MNGAGGGRPGEGGLDRLERAVRALIETDLTDGGEELLRRHADLRDLLEPMLSRCGDAGPEPEAEGAVPRRLGEFEILRELGRGGMGVVYEARQPSLGRKVALKVLGAHLTLSPTSIARFRREALTAARLDHPSIVRILAVGEEAGHHFFAMELVDGAPLDRVLERMRREPPEGLSGASVAAALGGGAPAHPFFARGHTAVAVDLVAQVAEALEVAHRAGVVHRDLKPSNILVRPDGTAVLTDFGLARAAELPSLTATGAMGGTPHYMSPEQAAGREAGARSDVFSLGVTLYEILTLRRPFDGDSAPAILSRIQGHDPPEPQKVQPLVPPDLSAVVMKAIEKEPERRYGSARQFADDLRAFLAYRPVRARRASPFSRGRRWARREPVKAALVVVLVVAAAGLASLSGYLLARGKEIAAGRERLGQEEIDRLLEEGFAGLQGDAADRSIPSFEEALRRSPGHPEALAGLVLTLSRRNRWQEALAVLDRQAPSLERFPGFRLLRAGCLRRLGRMADAEALERDPPGLATSIDFYLAGLWENELGRLRVPGAHRRALNHLSLAIRLSASTRRTLYAQWAIAAGEAGNDAERRECAEALERLWPDRPGMWSFIPEVLRIVDPDRARAWLKKELPAAARIPAVLRRLGTAHNTLGEYGTAERLFREWLALAPRSPDAWFNLGVVLDHLGKRAEARAAYQRSVELDPALPDAQYNLGNSFREEGRHSEAAGCYRKLLEAEPRFADAWTNLGLALHDSGDHAGGQSAFRKALEIVPGHPEAHHNLQFLAYKAGDFATVVAERERWARLFPEDSDAQRELAEALVHPRLPDPLRDPRRGLELAVRAVQLARGRLDVPLRTLATALAASGDVGHALSTADLALRLVPSDDPGAEAIRARIRGDIAWMHGLEPPAGVGRK